MGDGFIADIFSVYIIKLLFGHGDVLWINKKNTLPETEISVTFAIHELKELVNYGIFGIFFVIYDYFHKFSISFLSRQVPI